MYLWCFQAFSTFYLSVLYLDCKNAPGWTSLLTNIAIAYSCLYVIFLMSCSLLEVLSLVFTFFLGGGQLRSAILALYLPTSIR